MLIPVKRRVTQGGYRTTPHLTLSSQEFSVFKHRAVRSSLLASVVAVALLVTAGQATTRAAESGTAAGPAATAATAAFSFGVPAANLDPAWAGAVLAALSADYLGVHPGNQDTAWTNKVAWTSSYSCEGPLRS
ncbi:hypothetical protein ACFW5D_28170 [Streptomyces sp. NPDC058770]|uniref:hypothetical protein n=1 Tax=Streptomyces sp. NPDC058770 TaxID=3346631 RepID=UPI0036BF452D